MAEQPWSKSNYINGFTDLLIDLQSGRSMACIRAHDERWMKPFQLSATAPGQLLISEPGKGWRVAIRFENSNFWWGSPKVMGKNRWMLNWANILPYEIYMEHLPNCQPHLPVTREWHRMGTCHGNPSEDTMHMAKRNSLSQELSQQHPGGFLGDTTWHRVFFLFELVYGKSAEIKTKEFICCLNVRNKYVLLLMYDFACCCFFNIIINLI